MSPQIKVVSFTLFADSIIDATIHPAILQSLAILPVEWELAARPIINELQVQLTFTNQVSLTIKPDCIIFTEVIEEQLDNLKIPAIANTYLRVFSNLDYRSLSIIFQSDSTFDSKAEVDRYIGEKLLLSNYWQNFYSQQRDRLELTFFYPSESNIFSLEIFYNPNRNSLEYRQTPQNNIHAIHFNGNFTYQLSENNPSENIEYLQTLINRWQIDTDNFYRFTQQYF